MNRNEMIKWLSENTTQEQWSGRSPVFALPVLHWCVSVGVLNLRVIHTGPGQPFQPILFDDVFEQPVFIDGAEYWLKPRNGFGQSVKVRYNLNTNTFNDELCHNANPASGFGKHFTVELVTMGPAQRVPDYIVTGKGNINALSNYLKLNSVSVDIVAGEALSRLKEHNSLYERVVEALGEREVPIGGVDHLVGQIRTDHRKATLLGDIIKEFNIPRGGHVIKWLHERTTQTPVPTTRANLRAQPHNKYDREILLGIHVDVYDVLGAFKTDSAAIDHAVKKLLAPGQRGTKDRITDLNEAIESIQREIDRVSQWGDKQ